MINVLGCIDRLTQVQDNYCFFAKLNRIDEMNYEVQEGVQVWGS